jgi:nucleoside-diphosphate-sugar epimerase
MKILVLGGTRFFGAHLVKSLIAEGHNVIIATRGNSDFAFQGQAQFEKADRNNFDDLKRLSDLGPFDLIYDQVCMSAKNANDACLAFKGKCKRYIFTSTGSVYDPQNDIELSEELFDHAHYPLKLEDTNPYDYQEAKRQAEAVFSQTASFPVVMVRFPIVLGQDDYTNRLKFHVDAIQNEKEICFPYIMCKMGFIQSHEAGQFLNFIGKQSFTGAVNAVSTGYISLSDLVAQIEKQTGKKAIIATERTDTNYSPFGFATDFMIPNKRGISLGFQFDTLSKYLPDLINWYVKS